MTDKRAICLLLLSGCFERYETWQPDRSRPIRVNLVSMDREDMQSVVDGAELWNRACGRQVFDVRPTEVSERNAINVVVGVQGDGDARSRATSDRGEVEFDESPGTAQFAAHELGHRLVVGYDGGDAHSSDPTSIMRPTLTGGEILTDEDAELGCWQ